MKYRVRILAGQVDRRAGSHSYHKELTERLAARGHEVSLICFNAVPAVRASATVLEIPLIDQTDTKFWWRFASLLYSRQIGRNFMNLDIPPADVVICGEHLFLKPHFYRFPQVPLIYLPHAPIAPAEIRQYGLPPFMSWFTTHFYSYLQRWGLNQSDRTLRFTRVGCEMLEAYYGESISPRFIVNPIGFDLPQAQSKICSDSKVRLLSVGRLVPWKRIDLALTALATLRDFSWQFDIVGEGESRSLLEQQTKALGLDNHVRFHGYQEDLERWYTHADLFLFPSMCEGLGLVMLEAMSYGVPCVAIKADYKTYWNANAEVIEHRKTGLLATDEADFTRQLEFALRGPQQLASFGAAARRDVLEHYSWDKHLGRYEALFEELIQDRRHRKTHKPIKFNYLHRVAKKRILSPAYHHILVSRELGGAGLIALQLAKNLNVRTGRCHIWLPGDGPAKRMAESYGLACHELDSPRVLTSGRIQTGIANYQFGHVLHRYGAGLAHVHWPLAYGALRLGLGFSGLKRVVHVQLEDDSGGLQWAFKHPPELIITCAKYLVDYVRRLLPEQFQEQQRIVAVPNAVDTSKFYPANRAEAKHRTGAPGDIPMILMLANLAPHKGQETAIRAVAELKKRGSHVVCWLAGLERGGEQWYRAHLESLVSELNVSDRIAFIGYCENAAELLQASDFFLLPSSHEGLPISILEAQASKVPVLAAPTAGIPEVISDEKTGFLVDADNYIGYADRIEMLLRNRALHQHITQNAYEQVSREYSWASYCDRILGLYDELLNV